ncbi:ankyrin repeat domain-containing protein [Allosphingosinicella flava]|uniref:Ankyrin repeat domain-containing protein n=1 Tax=Allosphingosinicella flava TaxID=2771430 RepID=A0A7T2LLJ3_9SPHN|nr:ankyrin repeat domain-containing protein [Sphingosinicella flava]QPQ54551.1 ankyrin repeat domain-containing protein [Sphingosinicella flava]
MRVRLLSLAAMGAAICLTAPAPAQRVSDGYTFLKAIREGDGAKANALVTAPGSIVLTYKDPSTGEAAIHEVVKRRDVAWLNYLLGKGAKADLQSRSGDTAFTLVAQMGWIGGAEILVAHRANVNATDSRGQTPLILAVQGRDLPMVRFLLDAGADPRVSDRIAGYNALDYARRDNRAEAILRLLENPKPKQKDIVGPKF